MGREQRKRVPDRTLGTYAVCVVNDPACCISRQLGVSPKARRDGVGAVEDAIRDDHVEEETVFAGHAGAERQRDIGHDGFRTDETEAAVVGLAVVDQLQLRGAEPERAGGA